LPANAGSLFRSQDSLPTKTESLAEIRQGPPHLFSFVQKSGKAADVYFASGENQDSVMSVCPSCHFLGI
jgi:hypothetical protein